MRKTRLFPTLLLTCLMLLGFTAHAQVAVGFGLSGGNGEGDFANNIDASGIGGGYFYGTAGLGNTGLSIGGKVNASQYGYIKTDLPLAGSTVSISNSVVDVMLLGKLELPFLGGRFWPYASLGAGASLFTTDLETAPLGENPSCDSESTENLSKDWTKVLETGAGLGISLAASRLDNSTAPRIVLGVNRRQTGEVTYLYKSTENVYHSEVSYWSMSLGLHFQF